MADFGIQKEILEGKPSWMSGNAMDTNGVGLFDDREYFVDFAFFFFLKHTQFSAAPFLLQNRERIHHVPPECGARRSCAVLSQ